MAQQHDSTIRAEDKRRRAKCLVDDALDNLANALSEGKSQTLVVYLAAMARFHRYSFGNVLMIAAQRPDAIRVAGYRTWQRLGRQVKEGEKGILIFAPMLLKNRVSDSPSQPSNVDEPEKLLRFRVVHVFDVSQTEGEPLPEHARVNGDPAGFTDRLKEFASEAGIVVEYSHDLGLAQGCSHGGRILLRDDLSPPEFSTLAHERSRATAFGEKPLVPKTVRETEAEAVAFVVRRRLVWTPTRPRPTTSAYAGDKDTLSQSPIASSKRREILTAITDVRLNIITTLKISDL
jgi:hypothetical protein